LKIFALKILKLDGWEDEDEEEYHDWTLRDIEKFEKENQYLVKSEE
jgi:hypothetical protein